MSKESDFIFCFDEDDVFFELLSTDDSFNIYLDLYMIFYKPYIDERKSYNFYFLALIIGERCE